jgi:GT2 family glycosyltransferase
VKIGLGITTYNRPEFAEKCAKAIATKLPGVVDAVYLYNDGSDAKHRGAYERTYKPLLKMNAQIIVSPHNQGVAHAKNSLLRQMLEDECTWLFLIEDDILVRNPRCITSYIRIAEQNGLHHLSWAHHGPANVAGPVAVDGEVAFYEHSIGAFTMFSRQCLLEAGLFDEQLVNAWEHVEHELRLIEQGYLPGAAAWRYPDALGSQDWLAEAHNAIERSSIRVRDDWLTNIRNGLRHWQDTNPSTYNMLFGAGQRLEHYAAQIVG